MVAKDSTKESGILMRSLKTALLFPTTPRMERRASPQDFFQK
jgi:hypothetical protein